MQIIIVSKRLGRPRTFDLDLPVVLTASVVVLGLIAVALKLNPGAVNSLVPASSAQSELIADWRSVLSEQKAAVHLARLESGAKVEALAVKTAQLQSRLLRLDALAERMASMAKLDKSEFDFSDQPAMGGPEEGVTEARLAEPEFHKTLDELADQIDRREQQLEFIESLLSNRNLRDAGKLAGRPVVKGWMSSPFGYRTDPFKGHKAWHNGVDFAGKMGSDIIAVAAGVVTWADKRYGYGNLVQLNHGNGFSTRYGHNSEILVKPGDVVKKGQVIAKMGSSGRSTGAHVHFEVLRGGKSVDPASYISAGG